MKRQCLAVGMLVIVSCSALAREELNEAQITARIQAAVDTHARAIGCDAVPAATPVGAPSGKKSRRDPPASEASSSESSSGVAPSAAAPSAAAPSGVASSGKASPSATSRTSVLAPALIGALQPYQLDTMDTAEFVGFWQGRLDCTLSGTRFNLVTVKTDEAGSFYVDASLSEPTIKVAGLNQRFVQRVVGASLDTMTVEGLDLEPGDNPDYPTGVFRYTLKRAPDGNWKVSGRKGI